jgi:hypothetical protein
MFATIRRYDSIDQARTREIARKIDESLLPELSELPGFGGYYLIDGGSGGMSSIGFFDTAEQVDRSYRVTSGWLRENKLERVHLKPTKTTTGEVVVQKTRELVKA